MIRRIITIDEDRCNGCGACAAACPNSIISIVPEHKRKPVVLCQNKDKGADTRKACPAGCIGCMKCQKTCEYGAITVTGNLAHIDPEKCTNCGACMNACPRKLIVSVPANEKKVKVACANQDKGKAAMSVCSTSCIGCGLCQKECKKDAIHVENGVAVIDYDKCVGCKLCTKVCPRDAILPVATAEEKEKYKAIKKAQAEKAKAAAEAKAAEPAGK